MLQPKTLIVAAFLAATPIAVGAVAALTGLASGPHSAIDVIGFDRKWVLSVDEARALIASGALVIDARSADLRAQAPIRNAQALTPADLAGSDAAVTERLRQLGFNRDAAAVVIGDPGHDLGADAALVLALRELGQNRVALVDGGLPALLAAGLPTVQPPFGLGNAEIARGQRWSVEATKLRPSDYRIVESGLSAELLTPDGRLKTADQIAAILAAQGIDRDSRIAAAGQGSAWLATVLIDQGYDAHLVAGEYPLTAAN
ncbi:rhodanese-like domain-containing protein [Dongia sp.]|uniref:rhodanese-like domain-containing protein n=1 Tax=Dongia sp. TaxID=1977262 RepID=UPI0035B21E34